MNVNGSIPKLKGEFCSSLLKLAARPNRHSSHPDHCCCEVDEAEEVDGASVAASGEASEVFELVEASFDAAATSVDERIMRDRL